MSPRDEGPEGRGVIRDLEMSKEISTGPEYWSGSGLVVSKLPSPGKTVQKMQAAALGKRLPTSWMMSHGRVLRRPGRRGGESAPIQHCSGQATQILEARLRKTSLQNTLTVSRTKVKNIYRNIKISSTPVRIHVCHPIENDQM